MSWRDLLACAIVYAIIDLAITRLNPCRRACCLPTIGDPRTTLGESFASLTAWRPIETAPKDGTWLMLVDSQDRGMGHFPTALRWDSRAHGSGWWANDMNYSNIHYVPTHWMPLLELPKP